MYFEIESVNLNSSEKTSEAALTIRTFEFHKAENWKSGLYRCNILESISEEYFVSISKEDDGWIIFADDHDENEIKKNLDTSTGKDFYLSLKSAQNTIQPFCEHFLACQTENQLTGI